MPGKWAVICIDWVTDNVVAWCEDEQQAERMAERLDESALRAIAVPEGDSRIKE
ncbi:MAG TPA: hypothetical protein VNS88_02560 [Nitrospiraceae bacterium]|nr:hypothetical protein [Nitrospiraceae bacterium]